jgi:hypothetical protein
MGTPMHVPYLALLVKKIGSKIFDSDFLSMFASQSIASFYGSLFETKKASWNLTDCSA